MKKLIIALVMATVISANAEYLWSMGQYTECGGDYKYGGCTAMSLKVEAGVWPVAWGHSVTVVYTTDNWQTVQVKDAEWVANVNNPYGGLDEKWRASIPVGYTSMGGQLKTVEYALMLEYYGGIIWDNNGGMNFYFSP